MSALMSRRSFPAWLPPVVLIAGIIVAALVVIGLTRRAAAPDVPPQPDAFEPPAPVRPTTALDVQQAVDGRLTLSDGTANVSLRPDANVEFLMPAGAGDVHLDVALSLERVLDEPGNILFVFHDENTSTHTATLVSPGFYCVTEALNLGYELRLRRLSEGTGSTRHGDEPRAVRLAAIAAVGALCAPTNRTASVRPSCLLFSRSLRHPPLPPASGTALATVHATRRYF